MEYDEVKSTKEALQWFFIAGFFAVSLVVALYTIDTVTTNGTREKRLANTLRELRGAQIGVAKP
jgi:hypothetical protein